MTEQQASLIAGYVIAPLALLILIAYMWLVIPSESYWRLVRGRAWLSYAILCIYTANILVLAALVIAVAPVLGPIYWSNTAKYARSIGVLGVFVLIAFAVGIQGVYGIIRLIRIQKRTKW